MSSWEDEFRNRRKRECFCGDLTHDIKDNDLRNQEFNQCTIDPLGYIEKKYEEKLKIFCGTQKPEIRKLINCENTKKVINLVAEKAEGKGSKYEINYIEGIKKAIEDLEKISNKEIQIMSNKNKKFHHIESCLPTESYVLEEKGNRWNGISILKKLKSLLFRKEKATRLIPHTVTVTHEFKAKTGFPGDQGEHLKNVEKDFENSIARQHFDKLKEEKRILKEKKS